MKRVRIWLSLVIMSCMLLGMGLTAAAADSPHTNGVVSVLNAYDTDGKYVEVIVQELPEQYTAVAEELRQNMSLVRQLLGNDYVNGMRIVDISEVHVVGDKSLVKFPVTTIFRVPGVLSTTKVGVLHYNDQKGAWEKVPSTAGNGTITAVFDDLSPVAFIIDPATAAGATDGNGTSPETGEPSMAFAGIIALAAIGAAYVLGRKKEVNR